jgi:UDP-2,3-diacylglucosamine pyrophosphatase LpxH
MNRELESWAANKLPKNTILVCGHSHLAEYKPEKQFIDLGAHTDSLRIYLLINDDKMDLLEFS